jgi:hypothetical protein
MLPFGIQVYEKQRKVVVAGASERKEWSLLSVRRLMKESKLSQAPVSKVKGKPVRRQTLSLIRQAAARITALHCQIRFLFPHSLTSIARSVSSEKLAELLPNPRACIDCVRTVRPHLWRRARTCWAAPTGSTSAGVIAV